MASHALRSTNFRIVRSGYQILPRRWSTTVGTTSSASAASAGSKAAADEWERYKSYFHFPPPSSPDDFHVGATVTVHGFLGKPVHRSKHLTHASLIDPRDKLPILSVQSAWKAEESPEHKIHQELRSVPPYSSVCITGKVAQLDLKANESASPGQSLSYQQILLDVSSIQVVSPFPKDIIVSKEAVYPSTARHLQLRFSQVLRRRLLFRSRVSSALRQILSSLNFADVETPLLFKSTPEGAREFLVPTRRRGFAYALPQSPQQFKQLLMAGGMKPYAQFARCFRDEDLRADRQPEFTQLDIEMPFATGQDVMRAVEQMVIRLFAHLNEKFRYAEVEGVMVPVPLDQLGQLVKSATTRAVEPFPNLARHDFAHLSYQEAMASYGSDKPDLRIPSVIKRIEHILPRDFVQKISHLTDPVVEACRFRLDGGREQKTKLIRDFWDNLPAPLASNPDGSPGLLIYDTKKPLCGLSSLGHEAAAQLSNGGDEFAGLGPFEDGDVIIIQARENKPFQGGSTALGVLRSEFYHQAVRAGLLPQDNRFLFAWVTGFPLFTPDNDTDPGQGGSAGFSSTHHPFTAPLTAEDFDLMRTDPLKVRADHYDLVVNGVELGGGSRRIHIAKVQEFVMRDVLRMTEEGIGQFSHLLKALEAGCPPHAGFALGFDRLVAILCRTDSIRDVTAFPKTMKGEDAAVKSPSRMTEKQLSTYHLSLRK